MKIPNLNIKFMINSLFTNEKFSTIKNVISFELIVECWEQKRK